MCLDDIRIGRNTISGETVLTLSTTSSRPISDAPTRVGLIFHPPSSGVVTISMAPTAVAGQGIQLTPASPPLIFRTQSDGDLAQRGWSMVADAGAPTMMVIEQFFDRRGYRSDVSLI